MSKDVPFAVMVKPAGSRCNMSCRYCYYLGKDEKLGRAASETMKPAVLEKTIRSCIAAAKGNTVSFTWHGGEPTLAGLDFFRNAVRLQKRSAAKGQDVWNSLQTNGLALTEEWCDFLAKEHFDVGISLDGDSLNHDLYRLDREGKGTFERVIKTIGKLKDRGIRPDILCTVTRDAARRPLEIYRSLREMGTGWIQFIPIVNRSGERILPPSTDAASYGAFLNAIFDEWVTHDLGACDVQLFAETAKMLAGERANLCWLNRTCGEVPVIEKDGEVYLCDHFVDAEHRAGNIREKEISEIYSLEERRIFAESKRSMLPEECSVCPWYALCGGGCPKDRYTDENGKIVCLLCDGLRAYFEHAVPILQKVMRMSALEKTNNAIMRRTQEMLSARQNDAL